ncbi:MAG: WD40/YVTN/BNR-like repeat-containing protein [Microcystaceae cyanobacterium]
MTSLETVLSQVVKPTELTDPDKNAVIVSDAKIISLEPSTALLFMTLRGSSSLDIWTGETDLRPHISVNTHKTQTIVIKTTDGGENWYLTLNSEQGALTKTEIFALSDQRHLWFITHWDVAGSFPTLYQTNDFGETWQELNGMSQFLQGKGNGSFTFAKGLIFKDEREGIVIGEGQVENAIYFLKTTDGGKTWTEIDKLPDWYFVNEQSWHEELRFNNVWKVEEIKSIQSSWSISKSFGTFDILKSQTVPLNS